MRRRVTVAAALSVAGVVLAAQVAAAAPGDLDTSFDGDGVAITDFSYADEGYGLAIQSDGKIVAVGTWQAEDDFAVARYNVNGSLDSSFSGDGKLTIHFGPYYEVAEAVAIQANGKIVVVGTATPEAAVGKFAVARLNANGTLDSSFSGDGKRTIDFGSGHYEAHDVAIQADGKIVVVGEDRDYGSGRSRMAVARLRSNGTLDSSFSGDGKRIIGMGRYAWAHGVAIQTDGKIVLAGGTRPTIPGPADFAVARLNTNGSLDSSFSGDGKQSTNFNADDHADGVAIQADGKIVLAGISGGNFAAARYDAHGSLDSSFSADGKQTIDFGGNDGAHAVAIQANGKIMLAGGKTDEFAVACLNANGTLVSSFSGDGKVTTNLAGGIAGALDMAIQSDGRIVVVGTVLGDFAVIRYRWV